MNSFIEGRLEVLALDPGSQCGFALGTEGGPAVSGVWHLAPARGESPGMRYLKLRSRLDSILLLYPHLMLVAYERSFQRGQAAREIHHKFVGELESWCATHKIEHTYVYASTLKKHATGKGNATKAMMVTSGRRRWTPTTDSEDEMDALWILDWAVRQ